MFIRSENDLFFNADVMYVRHQDAGRDLSDFRGTGVPVMESTEDVPAMAYHRTFHAAIKGIQQDGLLVGGGALRNSGTPPTSTWHGIRSARMKWCREIGDSIRSKLLLLCVRQ